MDEPLEQTSSPISTKTNSLPVIGLIVAIIVIGGGILLLNNKSSKNTQTTVQSTSPAVQGAKTTIVASPSSAMKETTKAFTVTGANFSFDPKEITVKKGDIVKITFKNTEGFHDWNLDEFNAHSKKVKANEEDTITFTADKTGTFEYYCSVGSHRAMGMKGNLIVQ